MNIYRENILEHFKYPNNLGNLNNYDILARDINFSCGDEIQITLKLNKNMIKDARFQGKGCAISLASADILLGHVKGKSLNEIKNLTKDDILSLLGISLTPTRLNCAMLPLNALQNKIK